MKRSKERVSGTSLTREDQEQRYAHRFSYQSLQLHIIDGPHRGECYDLTDESCLLGRGAWCHVVLDRDSRVSNEHCELWLEPKGVRLLDKDSRNGSWLGPYQIQEGYLKPGHSFRVGRTEVLLEQTEETAQIEVLYADKARGMVGRSEAMRGLFRKLDKLAGYDIPLLLTGETGTGKTTVARALHDKSPRKDGPFIYLNCGTLEENLSGATLFGHEEGAFTGAQRLYKGMLEQAHGGTLFLDEIGDLPLDQQVKLLDVLERKHFTRLGGMGELHSDFRLISATHHPIARDARQKRFRRDLYHRISLAELHIPPLRERLEDLPMTCEHLLERIAREYCPAGVHIQLSPEAMRRIERYPWPGNVRELKNALTRSVVFHELQPPYVLQESDLELPEKIPEIAVPTEPLQASPRPRRPRKASPSQIDLDWESFFPLELQDWEEMLQPFAGALLGAALRACEWNVSQTAKKLQVSRTWLYKHIQLYGLSRTDPAAPRGTR